VILWVVSIFKVGVLCEHSGTMFLWISVATYKATWYSSLQDHRFHVSVTLFHLCVLWIKFANSEHLNDPYCPWFCTWLCTLKSHSVLHLDWYSLVAVNPSFLGEQWVWTRNIWKWLVKEIEYKLLKWCKQYMFIPSSQLLYFIYTFSYIHITTCFGLYGPSSGEYLGYRCQRFFTL
jgi:hypothetical protein